MTAQTKAGEKGRSYFLALENCQDGGVRPLADVIEKLAYNEQGLVPVVAQDARTGEVLMLAWMNQLAVEQTLATRRMTYFSRSRNELWIKGQTSGNFQQLINMRIDCDGDAVLCSVVPAGSACHTGRKSCFYLEVAPDEKQVHLRRSADTWNFDPE